MLFRQVWCALCNISAVHLHLCPTFPLIRLIYLSSTKVRSYAIETLSSAPDEELHLYLLQLVQALKYEEDVSGGVCAGEEVAKAGRGKSSRVSSLAAFLIERASRNIALANFLYW